MGDESSICARRDSISSRRLSRGLLVAEMILCISLVLEQDYL